MRFTPLDLPGAWLIEIEPSRDERGYFARIFDETSFRALGIATHFPQCSLSHNAQCGTLRGMHYSVAPSAETKLIRCVRGSVFDIIVDVRSDSPTYLRWIGVNLSAEDARAVFVPAGVAHGFLTLADNTDMLYQTGDVYRPELNRGFRWDDPTFGLTWPNGQVVNVVSARDASYPDFVA
jgi:dTDP-4-dehydrorhamnose 3,5-epimerase